MATKVSKIEIVEHFVNDGRLTPEQSCSSSRYVSNARQSTRAVRPTFPIQMLVDGGCAQLDVRNASPRNLSRLQGRRLGNNALRGEERCAPPVDGAPLARRLCLGGLAKSIRRAEPGTTLVIDIATIDEAVEAAQACFDIIQLETLAHADAGRLSGLLETARGQLDGSRRHQSVKARRLREDRR